MAEDFVASGHKHMQHSFKEAEQYNACYVDSYSNWKAEQYSDLEAERYADVR